MVKSCLTVAVERSVMEQSNWKPVGDLASSILQSAMESREKLVQLKAAIARHQAKALQPASDGIWVQLELPLPPAPSRPGSEIRAGRISRF
jgi:hypothetical protein